MRPLRELVARGGPGAETGSVEPLAILASVGRSEPAFDPNDVFDRAAFGLDASEVRALGPIAAHLCEVAWEALELSGLPLASLRSIRLCTFVGSPGTPGWSSRDAAAVADVLGLPGPAAVLVEGGASSLLAAHVAAQAVRAGEIDVALVLGDQGDGVGALVLGRPDRAAASGWKVRALLLGSAASRPGEDPSARAIAAGRAAVDAAIVLHSELRGLRGLEAAVSSLEQGGEGRPIGIAESGDTLVVQLVVASAEQTAMGDVGPRLLGLSARTPGALGALVRGVVGRIQNDRDVAGIANDAVTRIAFEHRVAVPAGSAAAVRGALQGWLDRGAGAPLPGVGLAFGRASAGGVAFVIPPAGAQYPGMGDQLYGSEPVFREGINRCDRALRSILQRPLLSVMFPSKGRESPTDEPEYANPLTFAMAYSLGLLLQSYGVVPMAVVGCGVGELVAATLAGMLEPEAAVKLAAERGQVLRAVVADAALAVLGASEAMVRDLLVNLRGADIVAVPTPDRVVVGGFPEAVTALLMRASQTGLRATRLQGSPVHTPLVDPQLPAYRALAEGVPTAPPRVPFLSCAAGRRVEHVDADHWVATVRAPMRLAEAVDAAFALGCTTFVELAARATVMDAGQQAVSGAARWYCALDEKVPDTLQFERLMAALWVRGAEVRRAGPGVFPGAAELPTYPWDRRPVDEELVEAVAAESPWSSAAARSAWLTDLPDLPSDPEVTLVPIEEIQARPGDVRRPEATDEKDLLDLSDAPIRPRLVPMGVPDPGGVDSLSDDSDPEPLSEPLDSFNDLTLDDLRIPTVPPPPGAGVSSPDGLMPMIDELEDMDVEPYVGVARKLEVAEEEADAELLWREVWVEDPLPEAVATADSTTWVILADADGVGDYLATLLGQKGSRIVRVLHEAPYPREDGTLFVPDPTATGSWEPVVEALGTLHGRVVVAALWSLDVYDDADADAAWGWAGLVGLVQELKAQSVPSRMFIVTRGAARRPTVEVAITGGSLWALAGLLQSELPELYGGVVDLDPDDEDADALLNHICSVDGTASGRPEFAFRGGVRWRRTLLRADTLPAAPAVWPDGCWILGGDVDGPLLELAGWLGQHGAKRVVLVSAASPNPDVLRVVLELQRKGVGCVVVRAEATERGAEQVRARLARETTIAGVVVRTAASPSRLVDLSVADALGAWRAAIDLAGLLLSVAGEAPLWYWSEARVLDGAEGGGVGAFVAGSLGARLHGSMLLGAAASVIHAAPAASFQQGQAVRIVTRLGFAEGVRGVWRG